MTHNGPKAVADEMKRRGYTITTRTDKYGLSIEGWALPTTWTMFGQRFPLRPGGWSHAFLSVAGEVYQVTLQIDPDGTNRGITFSTPKYSGTELQKKLEDLLYFMERE